MHSALRSALVGGKAEMPAVAPCVLTLPPPEPSVIRTRSVSNIVWIIIGCLEATAEDKGDHAISCRELRKLQRIDSDARLVWTSESRPMHVGCVPGASVYAFQLGVAAVRITLFSPGLAMIQNDDG